LRPDVQGRVFLQDVLDESKAHAVALGEDELGADAYVANEVFFDAAGRVSGETRMVVPEGGKWLIVEELQARFGVGLEETLAVGDGESDVAVFERAVVAVAVALVSEQVRAAADIVLEQPDLRLLIPRIMAYEANWLPLK
jgi:phosphoserine phosphatase